MARLKIKEGGTWYYTGYGDTGQSVGIGAWGNQDFPFDDFSGGLIGEQPGGNDPQRHPFPSLRVRHKYDAR